MAAKEMMSWADGRWHKKVPAEYRTRAGKTFVSISPRQLGTAATKEASRSAANTYWKALVDEWIALPEIAPPTHWAKERERVASFHRNQGDYETAAQIETMNDSTMRDQFVSSLADKIVLHQLGVDTTSIEQQAVWKERSTTKQKTYPSERIIKNQIKSFLDHKKISVSLGRWDNLRSQLNRFAQFAGSEQPIDTLTSAQLVAYFDHLSQLDELEDYGKRDTFGSAKQFISHLCELDLIPFPSKLRSKSLNFSVETGEIITYTTDELKTLYDEAVDRTKLFMLLAMNCGFTQVDISDLVHLRKDKAGRVIERVDLKEGRIIRKRSKTEKHHNSPIVNYKLWKPTHKLLKQFATNKSAVRVLTTEEGKPLMQDSLSGELRKKTDNIRSAFVRAMNAAEIPADERKGFSAIRATSSSMLDNHAEFSRFAQHWLGHAPKSVADKHYVAPSQTRFDAAVAWLGEQYDWK